MSRSWWSHVVTRTLDHLLNGLSTNLSVEGSLASEPIDRTMPVVILVVGTDRRDTLDGRFRDLLADGVTGGSADLIVLVAVDRVDERMELMWVPRRIGVDLEDLGHQALASVLDLGGASLLVQHVASATFTDIHHYVEVDFQGFAALVDAVGGLTLRLDHSVLDPRAGLALPGGTVQVDGWNALAFIRSRYDQRDDTDVLVSLGDHGRMERLMSLVASMQQRSHREPRLRSLIRLWRSARGHIVKSPGLDASITVDVLRIAARGAIDFGFVPTRPEIEPDELLSPFPPYQPSGISYRTIVRGSEQV